MQRVRERFRGSARRLRGHFAPVLLALVVVGLLAGCAGRPGSLIPGREAPADQSSTSPPPAGASYPKVPTPTVAPVPFAGANSRLPYQREARGGNEVRVRNPNEYSVTVMLRSGESGRDFQVGPGGTVSTYVGDGRYEIYFVYSHEPEALYQGDGFSLNRNGVEIRLVRVVEGNYNVRRVR